MGNKKNKVGFIGKVSKYGSDRKHIEVPKEIREIFKVGDYVTVMKFS